MRQKEAEKVQAFAKIFGETVKLEEKFYGTRLPLDSWVVTLRSSEEDEFHDALKMLTLLGTRSAETVDMEKLESVLWLLGHKGKAILCRRENGLWGVRVNVTLRDMAPANVYSFRMREVLMKLLDDPTYFFEE